MDLATLGGIVGSALLFQVVFFAHVLVCMCSCLVVLASATIKRKYLYLRYRIPATPPLFRLPL